MDQIEIERWHRLRNLKKASQFLVAVGVLLLAAGYAVSRLWVRSSPDPLPVTGPPESGMRIDNFSFSVPGASPWELRASKARIGDSFEDVALTDFKVVYGEGKGNDIIVSAKTGELDRKKRNVSAKGDVIIRYKDFLFKTDELRYRQDTGEAVTDSPVSLESSSLQLTGVGMKVLVKKKQVRIQRDVEAVLFNVKWVEPGRKLPM
jgi:LPS export ABC transporter protein LptC